MAVEGGAAPIKLTGGSFERMKQVILETLTDPEIERFCFHGWDGVGRSVFLRQVIDEFSNIVNQGRQDQDGEEEEEEDRGTTRNTTDSYGYQTIWVTKSSSTGDLSQSIFLKYSQKIDGFFYAGVRKLFPFLRQKILLVLDDLQDPIDLDQIGYVKWQDMVLPGSKVVITSEYDQVRDQMVGSNNRNMIQESWESLTREEVWDLLCAEAADVSHSLADFNISLDRETVMQCYSYLFLFPDHTVGHDSCFYWSSEGFIGGFDQSWKTLFGVGVALYRMLQNRAMLEIEEDDENFELNIPESIRSKVVPILNQRGRGFMVRCDLDLEEAPKVEEWEQDHHLKRISLAGNELTTLVDEAAAAAAHHVAGVGHVALHPPPHVPQLTTLILCENRPLENIPQDFFQEMQGLRVLDLSFTSITSLPTSLSSLTNLRLLALRGCECLDTLPLSSLHALLKLEVLLLDMSSFPRLTELSLHMMPNLNFLDISYASNLIRLSLRGCCSFQKLYPPVNLEMLDLSSTKVEDFSDFNYRLIRHLKHLDLLNAKHLKSISWHTIEELPETLNWNECSEESPQCKSDQGYCISVSDHEIFLSLSKDSELWKKDLKKFRFTIASCDHQRLQRRSSHDIHYPFEGAHFTYRAIYSAINKKHSIDQKSIKSYDRCLEIGSTNDVPLGIREVLYHTEFFALSHNSSITRLSHLGVENMDNLLECRIEKCRKMQYLITTATRRTTEKSSVRPLITRLETLLVFDLLNLRSLCRGTFGEGSFARLKHIHLENCPRLSILFSSSFRMEKLELLEIKFCDKLVRTFDEDDVLGQDVFPQLKELYLLKLPKLKCICDGNLPALEKLKVYGCLSLRRIPLPAAIDSKLSSVVIGDDPEWKKHLKWEEQLINPSVRLRLPRAFKVKY